MEHMSLIAKSLGEKIKPLLKSPGKGSLRGGFLRNAPPHISKSPEFGENMLRRPY
jgi:hypothetical protein